MLACCDTSEDEKKRKQVKRRRNGEVERGVSEKDAAVKRGRGERTGKMERR